MKDLPSSKKPDTLLPTIFTSEILPLSAAIKKSENDISEILLFDEPTMYCAKLRYCRTDNNLQVFKCEMDAGHSSKSGRTSAIEEVAFDYAFALKISGKLNAPIEN